MYICHTVPAKAIDRRGELGGVIKYPHRHGSPRAVCMDLLGEKPSGQFECQGLTSDFNYQFVEGVHCLKSALTAGEFGILTFFIRNDSMLFWRGTDDPPLGVGCVLVVGYDDANQWFILRSVRGADWGDDGYCYYPYTDWGHHLYCVVTDGKKLHAEEDMEKSYPCSCMLS